MNKHTLLDDVPTAFVVVSEMLVAEKSRMEREPRKVLRISLNVFALGYVKTMLGGMLPVDRMTPEQRRNLAAYMDQVEKSRDN